MSLVSIFNFKEGICADETKISSMIALNGNLRGGTDGMMDIDMQAMAKLRLERSLSA